MNFSYCFLSTNDLASGKLTVCYWTFAHLYLIYLKKYIKSVDVRSNYHSYQTHDLASMKLCQFAIFSNYRTYQHIVMWMYQRVIWLLMKVPIWTTRRLPFCDDNWWIMGFGRMMESTIGTHININYYRKHKYKLYYKLYRYNSTNR